MHDPNGDGDIEETEKINVVPLADLTLVLLIILMVLSPMISQSMIRVSTPQLASSTGTAPSSMENKEPLLIVVSPDGFKLNNKALPDLDAVLEQVQAEIEGNPQRPVIVSATEDVLVGQVVEVLDGARQRGAREVSLVKSLTGAGS